MRLVGRRTARFGVPLAGALGLSLLAGPVLAGPAPRAVPEQLRGSGHRVVATQPQTAAPSARPSQVRLGVELRRGADPRAVAQAVGGLGGAPVRRLDRFHHLSVEVPPAAADQVTAALRQRSDVAGVAPAVTYTAAYVPNDPSWAAQQAYLDAVAAPAAWDVTRGSAAVRVAVVDSGVDVNHPDLAGKVVGKYNSIAGAVTSDVTDVLGHGTHVAGIAAAASDNGIGVAGTGLAASLLAVKAGDTAFVDSDIAAGIQWATDHGADVINLSLGGGSSSAVLDQAVQYAQSHGVLVVAAAGNDGATTPSYPAALPGVVAVGATDAAGGRASFSNHGDWVTLAAPGVNLYSTVPTAGSEMEPAPSDGYQHLSGTSMATPVVAGAAALLLAAAPSLTADQVKQSLVSTAHGYQGLGLGTGQVDLAAALAAVVPGSPPTLTSPTAGAVVAGSTTLSATTDAPTVRFLVDGVPQAQPVPVTGGSASTDLPTWGLPDGAHTVAAKACNALGCGPPTAPVSVTVQNPKASITDPAAGTTVSGLVGVGVSAPAGAPAVRLAVDGSLVGSPTAVGTDPLVLSWSSFGTAQGGHSLAVVTCSLDGACGSPSDPVAVTVDNTAPALLSPLAGQLATGLTTLKADAPGGGVRFLLDGKAIGFDGTAPYALAKNFTTVSDGYHDLVLRSCDATGAVCSGPSTTTRIGVKSLHPVLKSVSPSVVSPNGDGRADRAVITYALPDTEYVRWSVTGATGTVVRGPVTVGTQTAGTRSVVWDGRTAGGVRAADGVYTVAVATSGKDASGRAVRGLSTRTVRVDSTAPGLSVTAGAGTFFPVADGYRDTVAPRVTVSEPAVVTMTVRNSAGTVVRTVVVHRAAAGAFLLPWNGRNNAGTLQPAGTYRYAFLARDVGQNRRASSAYGVALSWKRLYGTTTTRTLTPSSASSSFVGSCSRLVADPVWAGGYDYLSAYDYFAGACRDLTDPTLDAVLTTHQLVLPAAVKYGGISVVVNGAAADPSYPTDTGDAWYRNAAGNPVGLVTLAAPYGGHSLGTASPSLLYNGNVLRWAVHTDGGRWYAVQSFTVTYTSYVLR